MNKNKTLALAAAAAEEEKNQKHRNQLMRNQNTQIYVISGRWRFIFYFSSIYVFIANEKKLKLFCMLGRVKAIHSVGHRNNKWNDTYAHRY